MGRPDGNIRGKLGYMLGSPSPHFKPSPCLKEGVQCPALVATPPLKMRLARTISREVFVTPQRLYAEHPCNAWMVRQSELPSDRKPLHEASSNTAEDDMARNHALEAYKETLKLTRVQRETLVGLLLGDAHLETQNRGRTYRLKIEQSDKHAAYVQHLYTLFEAWVLTPTQQKPNGNWWFQTVSHGAFRYYAQQFYRDGRKVVPAQIHRLLKPRSLAYWFMDDGSIKDRHSRAVVFHTQGFTQAEVARLAQTLTEKFALETYLRRQAEGHQVVIRGASLERFLELVEPYLIPEMRYKLPPAGRTQLPKR